jgi:hypothetical protein
MTIGTATVARMNVRGTTGTSSSRLLSEVEDGECGQDRGPELFLGTAGP